MPERDESNRIMRLSPTLAAEIGLNESIALLQFQYLTHISTFEIEGEKWIRGSLPDLVKENFPFFSTATLSRVITALEKKGYIKTGRFNKFKYDRTQWLSVSLENCSKLNGFYIFQNETSILQIDVMQASKLQDASKQNETTIQETQEEIQEETYKIASAVAEVQSPAPVQEKGKAKPKGKRAPGKQPSDERSSHPAISAVRKYLPNEKYPNKLIYDRLIAVLGDSPDLVRLDECAVAWSAVSQNFFNFAWVLEWYAHGIPEHRRLSGGTSQFSSGTGNGRANATQGKPAPGGFKVGKPRVAAGTDDKADLLAMPRPGVGAIGQGGQAVHLSASEDHASGSFSSPGEVRKAEAIPLAAAFGHPPRSSIGYRFN